MKAGILANELLQEYTNVMKERAEAFAVLQRHYLPHEFGISNRLENNFE